MAKAPSAGKASAGREIDAAAEQRRMIAEAAYFRALKRGFNGGDPLDDWLAAEREISQGLLSAPAQKERKSSLAKSSARV